MDPSPGGPDGGDLDERPWLVLLTGEPGSGKTTLGVALAGALRLPFLARDDIRSAMFATAGAWGPRPRRVPEPADAVEGFLQILEAMAAVRVSAVAEYVLRRERPEDLARLRAAFDVVVVRTRCGDAPARLAAREAADRLLAREPVRRLLGHDGDRARDTAERMAAVRAAMATELELPTLVVDTDDGQGPDLEAVIGWVADATTDG